MIDKVRKNILKLKANIFMVMVITIHFQVLLPLTLVEAVLRQERRLRQLVMLMMLLKTARMKLVLQDII